MQTDVNYFYKSVTLADVSKVSAPVLRHRKHLIFEGLSATKH